MDKKFENLTNTEKLSLILNKMNFETILEIISTLDTVLNSLAAASISKKYGNIDYQFNNNQLTILLDDLNFYSMINNPVI
ncbi:MAG: hypothetical protein RMJ51_04780 [Candidatus Calescibacterium sp.]|nr:hypothetical protein [Candidatus Calescibacterium sp.]MCX7972729.1 hypothetical protein [bacterium]MDW8195533.1 hypothetical protein [Candidatus Calescibacterium sp.]